MKSPTHSFASSSSGSYSVNNTENGKKISPPKETINGKPLPPPIGTKPVTPPKPQTPPKPSKPQLGMATTEPLKPSEEPAGMAIRVVEFSRFLPKNQHTERKLLNFENWVNGEVSKIGHHFRK